MKIHKRSTPETRRRLSLNLGLLFATLGGLVLLSGGVWGLHAFQMKRVETGLLTRIEEAKEQSNWGQAAKLLERYMLMWPKATDQKVDLAEVYDKAAQSLPEIERLVSMQSVALGACEANPTLRERALAIRSRMVERLMQLGRQEDAMDQIARISGPTLDPTLERQFALCRYQLAVEKRSHRLPSNVQTMIPKWLAGLEQMYVPDLLDKALIDNPGDIELSMALASLYLGDPELLRNSIVSKENSSELKARAISVADRMLAANREDPKAWLSRYMISSKIDRVSAESDMRQALTMAPDNPDVLRQAGDHYLERARSLMGVADKEQKEKWLELSAEYFQRVRESSQNRDYELFLGLGDVLREQGKLEEALAVWRDGIRVCSPPTVSLHYQIVNSLTQAKRLPEAVEALREMDEAIRLEGPILPRAYQSSMSRVGKQLWSSYYSAIGDYRSATSVLEQVVSGNQEMDSSNRAELWAFLASAYYRMGQWDRAASAYGQAVVLSPTMAAYHRGAANAWIGAKRFLEALNELQSIDYKIGSDLVQIAETILELQKRNRPDPGLWLMFDNALIEAKRIQSRDSFLQEKPWVIEFLTSDGLAVRSEKDGRTGILETVAADIFELCGKHPNADDLWRQAISRLRVWGKPELANDLLERLSNRAVESTESAIAQAEILAQDGMASDARVLLERRLVVDPDNDVLKRMVVQWRAAMGEWDSALESMDSVSGKDIVILKMLCNLALRAPIVDKEVDLQNEALVRDRVKKWNDNVESLEKELRKVEGEDGTEWRYVRAKRLLTVTSTKRESDLSEVVEIVGHLDRKRPLWSSTYLIQGVLAERQRNPTRAIQHFTRALQLGEQELDTYERLADLLYRQGMLAEASSLIERLGERTNRSKRLSRLAIDLTKDDKPEMLDIARDGTIARPNDPMAWVWYAQILEVTTRGGEPKEREESLVEAKAAFVKANELSENSNIGVLGAEFNFYKLLGDESNVEDLVGRIRSNSKIDPIIKWVALAQISQTLGLLDDAASAYEEALKAGGDRVEIGRRVAQLYLSQGKQDEAISHLEKVLQESPKDIETKRALASLLASRGTEDDWERVKTLITVDKGTSTPDDRRLEAELLARRGTPSDLATAQYLLEGLVDDPNNRTDEDRFRLASVYLRNSKLMSIQDKDLSQSRKLVEAAGKQLKMASMGTQTPPEYIYAYGDFLLQQGKYQEALDQSERLSFADPEGFMSVLLKARLQKADERPDLARSTIISWLDNRKAVQIVANDPPLMAKLMVQAGQALALLGQAEDSEKLLREAFELDATTGVDYVLSLARSEDAVARKRAIQYLVDRVKQDRSASTAKLLANLLTAGKVDAELQRQGEEALSGIESENAEDADLLLAVADMWLAQNKTDKAIETYKKIVLLVPNDVTALNNLANLMAEQPGLASEALGFIDRAIAIAGRQPLLMDTKGVILMNSDRVEEAIPMLEIAAASTPDPRVSLHLYLALTRVGRIEEANRVRSKINLSDLRQALLTPEDRAALERLQGMSL